MKRFFLLSFLIHAALATSLAAVPARGGGRGPKAPVLNEKQRIVYTALVKQALKAKPVAVVQKGPIAIKKKKKEIPRAQAMKTPKKRKELPRAQAMKTPKKDAKTAKNATASLSVEEQGKLTVLKKYYPGMSDQELRDFKLPPGIKDWKEFDSITAMLDQQNWLGMPPELASESAKASGSFDPLAALSDLLSAFDQQTDVGAQLQKRGSTYVMAFQYGEMMFLGQWKEGEPTTKVVYFPHGQKPNPEKSIEVPVDGTTDLENLKANMQGAIIVAYQMAGSPR